MVLDTSALVAVLLHESEADEFLDILNAADHLSICAPSLLECEVVVMNVLGAEGQVRLHELLAALSVDITPFGETELAVASAAYRDFGKGRHAASLNLGDCFSYATAVTRDEPLLFKGNDFAQTDVRSAR